MPIIAKLNVRPGRRPSPLRSTLRTLRYHSISVVAAGLAAAAVLTGGGCGAPPGAEPNWEVELPFSQVDTVAVVDDAVFCLGSDADLSNGYAPCRMVIHSSASGAERFHTILDLRSILGGGGEATPGAFVILEGNTAVVLSNSGRLRAFEASTGREIWSRDEIDEVYGAGAGYVFASDDGSRLAAFDSKTGARSAADTHITWKQKISPNTRAAAADGRVFIATGHSLYALDVPGWRERWAQPFESGRSHIQVAGGCVIATNRNGWQVHDAETGDLLWRFEAYETRRPMPPTVVGDSLFTMRGRASNSEIEEGYLREYDLRSGDLKTRYAMSPLPEPDGVVAASGRLYLSATVPHYGSLSRPVVESTSGEELAKSLDCRPSALDATTGRTVWTGEPAVWGSLSRPSITDDGFVAVAAMSPKRNKPALLRAYRPVFSR